jgi:hypothetical protein
MQPQYIILHHNAKDITSQRFGRLVALGPVAVNANRKVMWLCQCDCGNTAPVASTQLRFGKTRSCGCLVRETAVKTNTIHGLYFEPLYATWRAMIRRCTNPSAKGYHNYGGRGIDVCSEWKLSFEMFRDHIINLPNHDEPGMTLDRIDNDGNYEPGNVRWATRIVQSQNSRRHR